ncbi:hypothetical protein [Vibrio lamellibrachiae]|uniref:hypothetical protein n=1 Tax=Vibrio lamellibrachiae TaxID=2910253 RepID=UPI003D107E4B
MEHTAIHEQGFSTYLVIFFAAHSDDDYNIRNQCSGHPSRAYKDNSNWHESK